MIRYKDIRILYTTLILLLFFNSKIFAQDPNFHIYLCFGQSNMAGAGDIETQDKTVDSRFQFMKPQDCPAQNQYAGNWYAAVPPLWGCTGGIGPSDYFGRTMVANLPSNIKVGVVVVGIPGCKIELFGKTGYAGLDTYNYVPAKYNGSAYAWLLDLAKKAQQAGVIKGFLLHQGESNNGDQDWPTKVKNIYNDLITDLGLNAAQTPLLAGELLYQDQGGACWGHNSVIAKLPSTLPNSYVISASGLPGKDQFHFTSAGNRTFGVRYATKMLEIQPPVNGPTVSVTAPVNNTTYVAPASVVINASATVTTGTISKVEFYNGTTKLGEDVSSPYSYSWNNVVAGTYSLTVVATDNSGNKSTSSPINVKVNVAQSPYNGTAWAIPGKIEFENYDVGGNGFAYLDNSVGTSVSPAPNFRTDEDVDIENCTDVGAGYNVGWATAGEWLEYTVNVAETGLYELTLRVACNGDGRTISISAKDVDIVNNIAIPNTTGWQTWTDVVVKDIPLEAGTQIIKLTMGATDYVNLNYMTFVGQVKPIQFITLKAGWNIIGCPLDNSTEISTALSSIWNNVTVVKDFEAFYDKSQAPQFNLLTKLEWGKGYYIKVNANCQLEWKK